MKVKNFYRVIGLSTPLLAAGVILAFAQPPSSSSSIPHSQVNSALATKIQTTATPASSIKKSTAATSKTLKANKSAVAKKITSHVALSTHKTHLSTNLTIKKPSISGSAGGDDSGGVGVINSNISSTLSPTFTVASGITKPSISASAGGDDSNNDSNDD